MTYPTLAELLLQRAEISVNLEPEERELIVDGVWALAAGGCMMRLSPEMDAALKSWVGEDVGYRRCVCE